MTAAAQSSCGRCVWLLWWWPGAFTRLGLRVGASVKAAKVGFGAGCLGSRLMYSWKGPEGLP